MRVLFGLLLIVSLFVIGVPAPPATDPWDDKSSIAAYTEFLFPLWPTHPETGCTQAIDDTHTAADCCAATSDGGNEPGNGYGFCQSSSEHNCPGAADKTCTAGLNNQGGGANAAACPEYVSVGGDTIYPRCRLVSETCKTGHGGHCWGTIQCYSSRDATEATRVHCPEGGFLDVSSQSNPVIYHENDFCFQNGGGDERVSSWCGSGDCIDGYIFDPISGTCGCPPPYELLDGQCICPRGANCGGNNPPGGSGDPQIGGFQGQSFQFHGLADEVFNLISTPLLQINSHFVYLSSGKCDYNDTQCWSHPGTYIDQLGFMFGDYKLKVVAGTHQVGLHMSLNGEQMQKGNYKLQANGSQVSIKYHHHGEVDIKTHEFAFRIHNSDMFFNMEASMLDHHLLRVGAPKHTITDSTLCKKEETVDDTKFQTSQIAHKHNHGAVEAAIEKKYGGVQVPLHGLVGQTWRNVLVCGKNWVGTVTDYVASDLFASDYFFNFYKPE